MSTPEESTAITVIPAELEKAVALTPLSKEKALVVCQVFAPYYSQAAELLAESKDIAVNAPIAAKEMRLRLKKVRCAADNMRADQNEEAVTWSRSVNAINKTLKEKIEAEESRLEKIEQAELIAAEERRVALKKKRDEEYAPYGEPTFDFSILKESDWQQLLAGAKAVKEAKIAEEKKAEEERIAKEKADAEAEQKRVEAAKQHEALRTARELTLSEFYVVLERNFDVADMTEDQFREYSAQCKDVYEAQLAEQAADEAERKRLKEENDRLQKIADDERKAREEADRVAKAAQAEKDHLARIEQDRKDEEARVERDRLQKIADEAQAESDRLKKIEADRVAKVAADEKNKAKAEAARIRAEKAAAKKAEAAPDREKLKGLALRLGAIEWPSMNTEEGAILRDEAKTRFDGVIAWLESESEKVGVEETELFTR